MAGRWGIASGIIGRWNELSAHSGDSPDLRFRAGWKADKKKLAGFQTIYDTQAVPDAPRPYLIFQQGEPVRRMGMGSKNPGKQNTIYDVPVLFVVYAFDKDTAKDLAEVVMSAFEEHGFWDCSPDKVAGITRTGDNPTKEGERQWSWAIRYTVQIDAEETNIGAA